ncbi:MAG: hypothetical protein NTX31_00285 [Burkholderiales bacterium]|nr:hypothetical protein [Burkholderiales bacterium]
MAYRKSSWRKLKPSQVLPIWTTANTNAASIVVKEVFAHLGVADLRTYFQQLRVTIVICAIVGASIGASSYDLKGLIIGALLGVAAPAALICLGTVLVLICIFLAVYCAAWAVILCLGWWLLGAMFGG